MVGVTVAIAATVGCIQSVLTLASKWQRKSVDFLLGALAIFIAGVLAKTGVMSAKNKQLNRCAT
jgi:F0F1-type ATP synthase assembly protein I